MYLLFRINDVLVNQTSNYENMLCPSNKFALQLTKYFVDKVIPRKNSIYKAVREVSKIVTEILREVEAQEPRFISSLNEINGRFEGLTVISPTEFEVTFSNIKNKQKPFLRLCYI
jgi:hypothetical protein